MSPSEGTNPPESPVDAELPVVAPQLRALRRRAALTLEAAARAAWPNIAA